VAHGIVAGRPVLLGLAAHLLELAQVGQALRGGQEIAGRLFGAPRADLGLQEPDRIGARGRDFSRPRAEAEARRDERGCKIAVYRHRRAPRLDHVEFGSNRSEFKNVIDSKSLSGLRAENRFALFLNPL
jgi:hypothetical protein